MIASAGSHILVTDDQSTMRESLGTMLRNQGYQVTTAASGQEALEILQREQVHLLLTDLQMPGMDGMALTSQVVREWPNTPVVILTGHGKIDTAVQAMRLGAVDFLDKEGQPSELLARLQRRLEERHLRSEVSRLSAEVKKQGRYGEIIGANARMREIFEIIEKVADKPSQVLIQGENGTGKELIARAIHDRSIEKKIPADLSASEREHLVKGQAVQSPYFPVNCGAFARNLLESQLFGHKKGAFTGAIADQEGYFVAARHGTLFLDEITELDLDLQVKLLRAIQEREVTPLGSTQPIGTNARLITATNLDIGRLVTDKGFRADLYYRINVVNIHVPPLRERVDDIPLLVDYFLKAIAEDYGMAGKEVGGPVMEAFQTYSWPGNVRELQNAIERGFVLGRSDRRIELEDLPPEILEAVRPGRTTTRSDDDHVFPTFDHVVREHLVRALQACRGVKARAATLLKIDRNRLYRLIEKYQINGRELGA